MQNLSYSNAIASVTVPEDEKALVTTTEIESVSLS